MRFQRCTDRYKPCRCGAPWIAVKLTPHGPLFLCWRCWLARYVWEPLAPTAAEPSKEVA